MTNFKYHSKTTMTIRGQMFFSDFIYRKSYKIFSDGLSDNKNANVQRPKL